MLCRELSATQLAEWRAYSAIRPWGERAADYRAAIIATLQANAFRGKNQSPRSAEDFLLCDDNKIAERVMYEDNPSGYFQTMFGAMVNG